MHDTKEVASYSDFFSPKERAAISPVIDDRCPWREFQRPLAYNAGVAGSNPAPPTLSSLGFWLRPKYPVADEASNELRQGGPSRRRQKRNSRPEG
jgi:hypothetical protein